MKLFRKDKKPSGSYQCPICGHVYRHAGMAERCSRTVVCRGYNMPSATVRELWRFAGGAASLGWFFARPIFEREEDARILEAAEAVTLAAEEVFGVLHRIAPCAPYVRKQLHDALMHEVAAVWEPEKPWHMGYVGDVVQTVMCDVVTEAKTRGIDADSEAGLRTLSETIDLLYARFLADDNEYENDTLEAIVRLSDAIIGPQPEGRKPSLYLVNERHLVVGRGRADVRRAMLEYGLSRPSIAGIAAGEKFEDGRTAAEIIKTAVCVPALIGRMEGA